MIHSLELKNFRAFEHLQFEDLGRANLILGGNNTGKTSILEALVLRLGSSQVIAKLPAMFRQSVDQDANTNYWNLIPGSKGWERLAICTDGKCRAITNQHSVYAFQREGSPKNGPVFTMKNGKFQPQNQPPELPIAILPTTPRSPAEISESFNQIAPLNPANEDKLQNLLAATIEPRLKRLRYAKPKGTNIHLIYADLGEGPMLPFTQLGQAFTRTLEIYCEIFANQPKVLLIDEIENGLYYEGLEDFWRGLLGVLDDQDVQLFATTHSRECMEAAHRAAKERTDDPLRFLRLDRQVDDTTKIVATSFGSEEMETAIKSDLEMR